MGGAYKSDAFSTNNNAEASAGFNAKPQANLNANSNSPVSGGFGGLSLNAHFD